MGSGWNQDGGSELAYSRDRNQWVEGDGDVVERGGVLCFFVV